LALDLPADTWSFSSSARCWLVHRRIETLGEDDAAMDALSIDERLPR
jgi:hypothetical protein